MSEFDYTRFTEFTKALRIETKELGLIRLGDHLMGTQRWFMRAMVKGLDDGKRHFVTLKCRQIGLSTISLAIDLYWMFNHRGLTGGLVVHDDQAREQFRDTLRTYHEGLPNHWRQPVRLHNRNHIVFGNNSKLQFKVAGTTARKASGSLGRSAALTFLHATEMSSWGDEEGLASLRSSLAESNPVRFYHWESTARGFNMFYDMWEEAKASVTQVPIFVSFWANEFYRQRRDSEVWRVYWGKNGRLTKEERAWVRDVKLLYDVEVDDEQLAWFRWKIAENVGSSGKSGELIVYQEFPPTEHHAFIATGSQFFGARAISDAIKKTREIPEPDYYRLEFRQQFYETEVIQSTKVQATLKIWEHPQRGAYYVLGCDPAYGTSELHDNHCISVWRAFADRLVQVAEFCDADMPTYACAWAMCWLAGAYDPCLVNLEISGPGQVVHNEIQNLRKIAMLRAMPQAQNIFNIVRSIQVFLYKRVDQLSGTPNALHWTTTEQSKERAMNTFRDNFERGLAEVKSVSLVNEMKGIVREEGKAPAASDSSRTRDDRVMAAALANVAWSETMMVRLAARRVFYEQQMTEQRVQRDQVVNRDQTSSIVHKMIKQIGWKGKQGG